MTMGRDEYSEWLALIERPQSGIKVTDHIRSNPPARAVQGRHSNMSGLFPSKKMGCTIQFESNSGELSFIRVCEKSSDVMEYYDQPPERVKISWTDKDGRNHGIWSTVDFFVLLRDGSAGWTEIKPESELMKWAEKGDRFVKGDDGTWSCPSAQAFAANLGLFYHVKSNAEFNQIFQRNFIVLYDFMLDGITTIDADKKKALINTVVSEPGITLSSLVARSQSFVHEDVLLMIARDELFIDLDTYLLMRPEQAPVYISQVMASVYLNAPAAVPQQLRADSILVEAGQVIIFDEVEYQIFQIGKDFIWLRNSDGKVLKFLPQQFTTLVNDGSITSSHKESRKKDMQDTLQRSSPDEMDRAQQRMVMISPYLQKTSRHTPSTARRWLNSYRIAELKYGNGFMGLFDETKGRGNRKAKLPEKTKKLIMDILEGEYETKANSTLVSAYTSYEAACENDHLVPASFRTFCSVNAARNKTDQILIREGQSAAYQIDIHHYELEYNTPRHGERPFEIVHIDHTQLDVEMYDPKTQRAIGRPWLTLMICAYTRRVLAVYITFESPSYRSLLMVFRECVRRYGRLPQIVIVDNGKEFRSKIFAGFCAFYFIELKFRPPRQPRFGSVIERIFGTLNTKFIYTLYGNTQLMKNPRGTSPSHYAANNAIWTFQPFVDRLKEFFYEIYDQDDHPAHFDSPRSAFERDITLYGIRSVRLVAYSDDFKRNTMPSTDKGTAKVVSARGVKINNIFYWCDDFRSKLLVGTAVPICYEPFNLGIAYSYVNGQWKRCLSEYFAELNGLTEFEAQRISIEIRANYRQMNKKTQFSAKIYRDFLVNVKNEQTLLMQQRRDIEGRMCDAIEDDSRVKSSAAECSVVNNGAESYGYPNIDVDSLEILPDL